MLKIRRSHDRFIFNMGIPYLRKTVFILRLGSDVYLALMSIWHQDIFQPSWWLESVCACQEWHNVMINNDSDKLCYCTVRYFWENNPISLSPSRLASRLVRKPCNVNQHLVLLRSVCCGCISRSKLFMWFIYPYSSGLLHWYWGNRTT